MGKLKQTNQRTNRADPIFKPVKPPSDPILAAVREKQVLPIINDLTSPEPAKRSSAAAAIANAVEDTKFRKLLLREQIVRILLEQTITDSALESKCAAWGILRNIALEEESDFCIHLYRQDILTATQSILGTIIQAIDSREHPIEKQPRLQQEYVWKLTGSVIGIISSLAEAQDEILEAISKIRIIPNFLFGLLSLESLPIEVFQSALACLATLTEDNEKITNQIVEHEAWLKGLLQLRDIEGPKSVASCGILHNIFSTVAWFDHNTPVEGASDATLVTSLVHYMSQARKDAHSNGLPSSDSDQSLHQALEILASIATTLQEALEHASRNEKEFEGFQDDPEELDGIIVENEGLDIEEKDDAEDEGLSRNGEMDEDAMDADMDLVAGADLKENEESIETPPTLKVLVRTAIPVLLSLISSTTEAVRSSALSSLNNIAWTISSINLESSNSSFFKQWTSTAQEIWSEVVSPVLASNTADIELASTVTSIAWALARSLNGRLILEGDESKKFMALYQASRSLDVENGHASGSPKTPEVTPADPFQGLGVKCIGVLGRLALDPAPILLNREIGIFLLTVLSSLPDTPPADAVEALNQIFDIYADKEYACDEVVFWADGFYKHLEAIAPNARKMAKSIDKRKLPELRERADEAILNLTRFLAYKKKEKVKS